ARSSGLRSKKNSSRRRCIFVDFSLYSHQACRCEASRKRRCQRLGEIESVAVRTTIQAAGIDSFIRQLRAAGKTNRRERILASTKALIHIWTSDFSGNDTDGGEYCS